MKALAYLCLALFSVKAVLADQPLCEQAKSELSRTQKFISCKSVDFQKKAVSSSYQPSITGPLLARPSDIKDLKTGELVYANEHPGIAHLNDFFKSDQSLMTKFYSYIDSTSSGTPNGELIKSLVTSDKFFEIHKDKPVSPWEGNCKLWSAWSLDPEIASTLDDIKDGVLCSHFAFSKGEIKEMISAFYPMPDFTAKESMDQFFDNRSSGSKKNLTDDAAREDANIALAKLGELGSSSRLRPDSIFRMAELANRDGKNIIFDLDPGNEVWNQPMEEIADLTYEDDQESLTAGYVASDYAAGSNDPGGKVLTQIRRIQADLKVLALKGKADFSYLNKDPDTGIQWTETVGTEICNLKRNLNQNCDDMITDERVYVDGKYITRKTWMDRPLSEQVNLFWTLEALAVNQGLLVNRLPSIQQHKLVIRYGVEGRFSESKQMDSKTRTLQYSKIGDRSAWSPPTTSLKEVCNGQMNVYDRNEGHSSLVPELADECAALNKGTAKDREVFIGALPPKQFKVFTAGAIFGTDSYSKQNKIAYEHLLDMVKNCESFDAGADFLRTLDRALSTNDVTKSIPELKADYEKTKNLLDQSYIRDHINEVLNGSKGVKGLTALDHALFP